MSGTRTVRLRYGRSTIELAVPAAAELLEPREPPLRLDRDSFRAGLAAELPEPLPSGPIVIVVADKTRLCGYPTVLPWLVELLAAVGLARLWQTRFQIGGIVDLYMRHR